MMRQGIQNDRAALEAVAPRIRAIEWHAPFDCGLVPAPPKRDEILVWTAGIPEQDLPPEMVASLSVAERARADRFVRERPRQEFRFGRALLRRILGTLLEIDPAAVKLGIHPLGKPFLIGSDHGVDLRFNLSHTAGRLAIAVACGREVGIDLESTEALDDWETVAARIFSTTETNELRSLPKPHQREAFFRCWARKEAYLKATGDGLIDDLAEVEVSLSPGRPPALLSLPNGRPVSRWKLHDLPVQKGFAGTLAFESNGI